MKTPKKHKEATSRSGDKATVIAASSKTMKKKKKKKEKTKVTPAALLGVCDELPPWTARYHAEAHAWEWTKSDVPRRAHPASGDEEEPIGPGD